jgi:hypothetical protein
MRIERNGQWTEVPKECLSGISFGVDGLALSGDEAGLGIFLIGKSTDKDEPVKRTIFKLRGGEVSCSQIEPCPNVDKATGNSPSGSGGGAGVKRFGGAEGGDFPSRNAGIGFESADRAWDAALKEMRDLGTQYYPNEAKSSSFIPELGVEIFKRNGLYYYDQIARGYQEGALGGGVGFGDSSAVARGHMHWDSQLESDGDRDNARAYSQQTPDYKAWVGSWNGAYLYWHNGKPTESRMPDWNRYKY